VYASEHVLRRRYRARMNGDRSALLAHLRRVRAATCLQLSDNTGLPLSRVLRLMRWMEREGIVESLDRYNETFLAMRGGRPRRYYRIRRSVPAVDSFPARG
jgi:predicted transcriptional regulator